MPRDAAGRRDTANQRAAKLHSAEKRQCPECQRKSAMVKVAYPDPVRAYCQWCGYERRRVAIDEHCGYTPANCPWGDACADCRPVSDESAP
jgi:hypothetical protein